MPRKERFEATKEYPLRKLPPVPSSMSDDSKKFYRTQGKRLISVGLLTETGLPAFRILCESFGLYSASHEYVSGVDIKEHGTPEMARVITQRNKYFDQCERLCKQFGLTPESLRNLGLHGGTRSTEDDQFLNLRQMAKVDLLN